MRFCAVSWSQRSVATCSMLVWPDLTTIVPSSMYGWRVFIAPLKKNVALLSSSDPAKSSTLNGPVASPFEPSSLRRPRPTSSEVACWTPTFSLSKVT